jgi:hypothetical protein
MALAPVPEELVGEPSVDLVLGDSGGQRESGGDCLTDFSHSALEQSGGLELKSEAVGANRRDELLLLTLTLENMENLR